MKEIQSQEKTPKQSEPVKMLIDRDARQLAAFLTEQSERFSQAQKKIILLTCGVLAAAAALALILLPFTTSEPKTVKPEDTLAVHSPIRRYRTSPMARSRTKTYPPALHLLDSIYRNDSQRFALRIKERLKMIDSLKAGR